MPVTLSQIASNSARIVLQVQTGDTTSDLTVEYYPGRITEDVFANMQQLDHMDEDVIKRFSALNTILATVMKSWDLYEDEEQQVMVPFTEESLRKLPVVLRMGVLMGIVENMRPNQLAPQMKIVK